MSSLIILFIFTQILKQDK
uniref:Uncharacterized protein n=1 Tax=Arundo donax TaxID=35708 RepID=A0A0A9GN05_ARUDO